MDVRIYDENRDRYITLNLPPEEYERIKTDQVYLAEVLRIHYANNEETNEHPNEANPLMTDPNNILPHVTEGNEDQNRSIFIWNDECVFLLLSLYEDIGEDWKYKRHKKIYEDIAANMRSTNPNYDINGSQCQSKMTSLKKNYKKIKDHNGRSGNNRMTWPYFERMDQIFGNKSWVRPPAVASEAGPSQEEQAPGTREPRKKSKLESTMQELMQSRKERVEERKEFFNKFLEMKKQQHEEKMNILKELCQNLSNNK